MYIQASRDHQTLNLCIQRSERCNAIGTSIAEELSAHITQLKAELSSANPPKILHLSATSVTTNATPIWIAGGDLKELAPLDPKAGQDYAQLMSQTCHALTQLPIIVIITVHGRAIGGGAELAICGDIRLATECTRFEWKQLAIGLAPGYGGAGRLLQLVGLAQSQRLLFLEQSQEIQELRACGLIHEAYESHELLMTRAIELSQWLSRYPRENLIAMKEMLQNPQHGRELELFQKLWGNPFHRQQLDRFVKREKS